jgi:hypothetical protein
MRGFAADEIDNERTRQIKLAHAPGFADGGNVAPRP